MVKTRSEFRFLVYSGAIFVCYSVFAMLQEKITRSKYGENNEKFTCTLSLVLTQCIVNYTFVQLLMVSTFQWPVQFFCKETSVKVVFNILSLLKTPCLFIICIVLVKFSTKSCISILINQQFHEQITTWVYKPSLLLRHRTEIVQKRPLLFSSHGRKKPTQQERCITSHQHWPTFSVWCAPIWLCNGSTIQHR